MSKEMILGLAVLVLAGCDTATGEKGWLRDQSKDYQYSQQQEGLRVPAGLETLAYDEHYEIKPFTGTKTEEVSIVPPGLGL